MGSCLLFYKSIRKTVGVGSWEDTDSEEDIKRPQGGSQLYSDCLMNC